MEKHEVIEIGSRITLPYLKRDYAEYVIPDRLCDLLMENGYIHNGEWMIKI